MKVLFLNELTERENGRDRHNIILPNKYPVEKEEGVDEGVGPARETRPRDVVRGWWKVGVGRGQYKGRDHFISFHECRGGRMVGGGGGFERTHMKSPFPRHIHTATNKEEIFEEVWSVVCGKWRERERGRSKGREENQKLVVKRGGGSRKD